MEHIADQYPVYIDDKPYTVVICFHESECMFSFRFYEGAKREACQWFSYGFRIQASEEEVPDFDLVKAVKRCIKTVERWNAEQTENDRRKQTRREELRLWNGRLEDV